jgi:hypothetical protein
VRKRLGDALVPDKEERDEHAEDATARRDDEGVLLSEMHLDWRKRLGTDDGADFSDCGRETVASTANRRRVRFCRCEPEHVARSCVTEALHQSVKDDKCRDDLDDCEEAVFISRLSGDRWEDRHVAHASHTVSRQEARW